MNMDKKDELKEYGWEEWTERIWMRRINWMNIDEKGKLNEYMNVKNEMNEYGGEGYELNKYGGEGYELNEYGGEGYELNEYEWEGWMYSF